MKRTLCTICVSLLVLLVSGAPAWSTVITWDFGAPTALQQNTNVGSSSDSVTLGGFTLIANGFAVGTPDAADNLYWKNLGTDEHGLGFVNTLDNEIVNNTYIQIDINAIKAISVNGMIRVQSVTAGEAFNLYGTNTPGNLSSALGNLLISGNTTDNGFVSVPSWGTWRYLDLTVTNRNVSVDNILMDAIQANTTVPEPGTAALLGLGLGLLGLLLRRARTRIED